VNTITAIPEPAPEMLTLILLSAAMPGSLGAPSRTRRLR
jgi:hypothetical protein